MTTWSRKLGRGSPVGLVLSGGVALCVLAAVANGPFPSQLALDLPFRLAFAVGAALLLASAVRLGSEEWVTLEAGRLRLRRRLLGITWGRTFRLGPDSRVFLRPASLRPEGSSTMEVAVSDDRGREVRFAGNCSTAYQECLVRELNELLSEPCRLKPEPATAERLEVGASGVAERNSLEVELPHTAWHGWAVIGAALLIALFLGTYVAGLGLHAVILPLGVFLILGYYGYSAARAERLLFCGRMMTIRYRFLGVEWTRSYELWSDAKAQLVEELDGASTSDRIVRAGECTRGIALTDRQGATIVFACGRERVLAEYAVREINQYLLQGTVDEPASKS